MPERRTDHIAKKTKETTMGLLDGKVAIVTGAGRGIGRAEALLLASEGARVIVNDVGASLGGTAAEGHPAHDVVELIVKNGGEAEVNADDISSWDGAKHVVEQAVDTYGGLDILVNNAGIVRDKMSFNTDESEWDDVIRVHLKGHFAPIRHAAEYWRNRAKSGEEVTGRIINTSSEAGLYGNPTQANYGAAKAGIAALTWIQARELERYGVTVNAIAPRARTRMTEGIFVEAEAPPEGTFDPWDPQNVANLVGFLAAPAAADINGQIFVVFGASIWAMSAFVPVGQVTRDHAWTPQELLDAKGELFNGIESAIGPFELI
jgi:NAD(P)-dependent dehydrogenase (short-subunit alcohol dehydrogenase family)